jgi:hypothetical protein
MASFLHQRTLFTPSSLRSSTEQTFKLGGLVLLVLVTLSSCSRAAYIFSPGQHAYLTTEQPAPSVPLAVATPIAKAPSDSLRTPPSQRAQVPARPLAKKPYCLTAGQSRSPSLVWTRPLATKLVARRLAKLAARPHRPDNDARYQGIGGSSTLVVALCLLGAGLLGMLIGVSISTSLVGVIFGAFLVALGAVALLVGLFMLLIALIANE